MMLPDDSSRREIEEACAALALSLDEYLALMERADRLTRDVHGLTVSFERSVFFSWYCSIRDCTFCYMSTQPKQNTRMARRSYESLYAEAFLCRLCSWEFGFLSGGVGVYTPAELEKLVSAMSAIVGHKIWLNAGVLSPPLLERLSPWILGVVGSVETVDRALHKKICPSKPLEPVEAMFTTASRLGLKNAMTVIIGIGEKPSMIDDLIAFIKQHRIEKIHVYGLNPQKGTAYEHAKTPSKYVQAWWIARLRLAFPLLEIEAGVWEDRIGYIPTLLRAGANSLSKYPATKLFGKEPSVAFERAVAEAGRVFQGTLTRLPPGDWKDLVEKLDATPEVKRIILEKAPDYLDVMTGARKLVRRGGKGKKSLRKIVSIE